MRIAVFPGSFDPVTLGHRDIIARASKLFDRVYVSIVPNGTKTHPMFSDEQKLELMRASVAEFPDVEAELGGGLLTDYALRKGAQFLVRGVRNSVDFDAEQQLSLIYRDVSDGALETVLLVAEPTSCCSIPARARAKPSTGRSSKASGGRIFSPAA